MFPSGFLLRDDAGIFATREITSVTSVSEVLELLVEVTAAGGRCFQLAFR